MLTFRDMTFSDADAVTAVEEECFTVPWKKEDFIKLMENDTSAYIVAELNGEIIGGAGIRNIVGDGEITNVAIKPAYRGNGYSKELINHLLDRGKQLGCTAFTLEVRVSNTPAIKCYESAGFESAGIRPNFYEHPKEDAMIMWLR